MKNFFLILLIISSKSLLAQLIDFEKSYLLHFDINKNQICIKQEQQLLSNVVYQNTYACFANYYPTKKINIQTGYQLLDITRHTPTTINQYFLTIDKIFLNKKKNYRIGVSYANKINKSNLSELSTNYSYQNNSEFNGEIIGDQYLNTNLIGINYGYNHLENEGVSYYGNTILNIEKNSFANAKHYTHIGIIKVPIIKANKSNTKIITNYRFELTELNLDFGFLYQYKLNDKNQKISLHLLHGLNKQINFGVSYKKNKWTIALIHQNNYPKTQKIWSQKILVSIHPNFKNKNKNNKIIGQNWLPTNHPNPVIKNNKKKNIHFKEIIYYKTNDSIPEVSYQYIIENIITLLKEFPQSKVEITGYSDTKGTIEQQKEIAINRALYLKNELLKKGIALNRISTALIIPDKNDKKLSDAEMQNLRKTEIIIK